MNTIQNLALHVSTHAADVHYSVKVNIFHSVLAVQTTALGFNGHRIL